MNKCKMKPRKQLEQDRENIEKILAEASGVKNLYILRGINPEDGEIIERCFCASHYGHAIKLAVEGRYLLKPNVVEGIQGKEYLENKPYGIIQ